MPPHPARTSSTSDRPAASSAGDGSRPHDQTSVSRRELLATAAIGALGGSAGCSAAGSCDDVAITDAYTEVAYGCDLGPYVSEARLEGSVEGCPGTPTVELVDDGEVLREHEMDGDGDWSVPDAAGVGTARLTDLDKLRVRDASGDVVAEQPVEVDHYRDAPSLGLAYGQLEADSVDVGEPVTASVAVTSDGAATDYTLHFRVNSGTVAEREGHVEGGPECGADREPMHEFTRAFDEPGEYRISAVVGPGGSVTGLDHGIGTVTVGEDEPE